LTFKLIHGASVHVALILVGLMPGVDRDEVLSPDWEPLQRLRADHSLHPSVDEVASASFRRRSPPEIVGEVPYYSTCLSDDQKRELLSGAK